MKQAGFGIWTQLDVRLFLFTTTRHKNEFLNIRKPDVKFEKA